MYDTTSYSRLSLFIYKSEKFSEFSAENNNRTKPRDFIQDNSVFAHHMLTII